MPPPPPPPPHPSPDIEIVRLATRPARGRILGIFPRRTSPMTLAEGFETFQIAPGLPGVTSPSSADIRPLDHSCPATDPNAQLVHIRTTPQPAVLTFPRSTVDSGGQSWDLLLEGSWTIADPRQFLGSHALALVTPDAPLLRKNVEAWIAGTVADRVHEAARAHTIQELTDQSALPPRWWETQLTKWLAPHSLSIKVTAARWESADAARVETEERRRNELTRLAKQKEEERQAELRELAAAAAYSKQREQLELDRRLTDADKSHQLELLERQRRAEILHAEQELELLRQKAEKAATAHQLELARLKHDAEMAAAVQQKQVESDERHKEVLARLAASEDALKKMAALSEPLLQRLNGRDKAGAFQTAERLTSPEFSLSPTALADLGFAVSPQEFVGSLKRKHSSHPAVHMRKEELLTRDIGAAKIKALPIGSPLQFSFTSNRPGFATILNFGTSGTVYLQVPNAFRPAAQTKIAAQKPYSIPGPELFPWEHDYREEGPPGWEHLVVIISDQPLFPPALTNRSTEDHPFIPVEQIELEQLHDTLQNLPPGAWSAGVLSFLVG